MTKPLLIYDGDCGFCRRWIRRWQQATGESVDYAPYQEIGSHYPQIPPEKFRESVQFVDTNGRIYEGAEAVFRTLAYAPNQRWMLWAYQKIPGVRPVTVWFYRLVARHRIFFSKITRIFLSERF